MKIINWLKDNWFKILMWAFFFLFVYSLYYLLTSGERFCGPDDIYDWNCGDLNIEKDLPK